MAKQRVIIVTGAGRGLGNSLAQAYLAQRNCTVVGTIRDETSSGVSDLKACPKGDGSQLLLVRIESSSPQDALRAVDTIKDHGIEYVDVLVANAGVSPPVVPLETVGIAELKSTFDVNALGPLVLYQACFPLLQKSSNPKFVTISSAAGSIGNMPTSGSFVAPAYCISKAALNWITLSAHCGNQWLISCAINPGLVATDMGNKTAKYLGMEKAPITKDQSTEKIISMIDSGTRESISGKFLNAMDGKEIPW